MYIAGCKRYRTLRRKSMYCRPRFAGRDWSWRRLVGMASSQSFTILGQNSQGWYSIETRNFESFKIREYILYIREKSEKEEKACEVRTCTLRPHYFVSFTKPPLWGSILIKFGFLIKEALWKMRKKLFRIFLTLCSIVLHIC